jgi:pimeloyl-ACP methyl ester carboxylesterase
MSNVSWDNHESIPRGHSIVMDAKEKDAKAVIYKTPDRVIPVIFLPGVMGSNLMTKNGNGPSDALWRLDDNKTVAKWFFRGPKDRRQKLDPNKVVVDPGGKIDKDLADCHFISRRKRGWGEVSYLSYGQFLPWLQSALDDFDNAKEDLRTRLIGMNLNLELGEEPLGKDEVSLSYKYLYPVHVVGYNWLDSIVPSSEILLSKIIEIIQSYKDLNKMCEKVILVTHSMGGLVARYCSELKKGNNLILGVVHGVLPAIGAASAYRRMKAGMEYEGVKGKAVSLVAGGNAAEMTAVLSQSPGPLQLLPGIEYGRNWFKIKDGEQIYQKPNLNPFVEIYKVRGYWWSLCEENLIDPNVKTSNKEQIDNAWQSYRRMMDEKVQPVIEALSGCYHNCTHSFYGGSTPTLGDLIWEGSTNYLDERLARNQRRFPLDGRALGKEGEEIFTSRTVATPLGGGGWKTGIYQEYKIADPTDLGDGTVPVRSSKIPDRYLRSRCKLSVAHEPAYTDPDAQVYTLWAIIKIVQEIKQTSLRYHDAY